MRVPSWLTKKRLLWAAALTTVCGALAIWACDSWVKNSTASLCHADLATVPGADVGLVLGCSPKIGARPNQYYTKRIQAAAELFKAGKVRALIVSGDNSTHAYDEPSAMKADLEAAGVPGDRIYCDYAGFRTLDSVVRANSIFGQSRYIVISQQFHNERAIFLARRHGLEALGYNAPDVTRHQGAVTRLREYFARVKAVLDVTVLQTRPKFGGPAIAIQLPTA